jgi:carbonic anhydrase
MVHHEKRFETISKAAVEKNGVAVLGILFHVAAEPNPIIEKVLFNSGSVFEAVGRNQTYKEKLLLMDLLPKNKYSYFRYEGSLTTPGCGEAVVWTVFENSIPISMDQVIFVIFFFRNSQNL